MEKSKTKEKGISKLLFVFSIVFCMLILLNTQSYAATTTWGETGLFGWENSYNTGGDTTKHYELWYNNGIGGGDQRTSYYDSDAGVQGYSSMLKVDGSEVTFGREDANVNNVRATLNITNQTDPNGNIMSLVVYTITNNNSVAKTVDLCTFADIALANDDNAPIKVVYNGSTAVGFSSSSLKCQGMDDRNKVTLNYFFKGYSYIDSAMAGTNLVSQTIWTGSWREMYNNRWSNNLRNVNSDDYHTGGTEEGGWTDTAFAASWKVNVAAGSSAKVAYMFTASNPSSTKKITYNANGGTGSMATDTVEYWSSYVAKSNTFTRTCYAFDGWATSPNGAKVYNPGDTFTVLDDTTLYAVWKVQHDWGDWFVSIPETCTEEGQNKRICKGNSAHVETSVRPAYGNHDWGEWFISVSETCTEEGQNKRICSRDSSHVETSVRPALGHVDTDPYDGWCDRGCGLTQHQHYL